jgi:hypothetical protein
MKKRKQRSDHEQEEEEVASSRAGGTPQKRDRRSSPEQANSESDERPGGSYSPKVLCTQAMGRNICVQRVVFVHRRMTRRGLI